MPDTQFQVRYLSAASDNWDNEGLPFNTYKEAAAFKRSRFEDAPEMMYIGVVIPFGNLAEREKVKNIFISNCSDYGVKYCRIRLPDTSGALEGNDKGVKSVLCLWFKNEEEAEALARLLFPCARIVR